MKETMSVEDYKKTVSRKGSKYRNQKTEYGGRMFDSKKEADYARTLEYLKHAHELKDRVVRVEYQVPFSIKAKNIHISTYFADFRVTYGDKRQEVIDVKGMKTPVYKLKKRLVEALHNVKIIEV